MTPLHCLFALSLFWWPEPLGNVSGWASMFKSLGPSSTTFEPLAAFRGEGQIIAHFLWRSYNLHIYYGIFCTGCSVGGQQRPISPQVWTKAWQRYFQCRQCSLLSSLVIQIPVVNAVGLVDQKSFLILLRQTAFLQQHLLIRSYVDEVFCSRNAFGTTANNSMIIFVLPQENMFGKINMSDVWMVYANCSVLTKSSYVYPKDYCEVLSNAYNLLETMA